MNYRRLGRAGIKVSELSFGSWVTYGNQMDTRLARECMAAAFDAGVNFFDNAEVYAGGKSEEIMGEVLKQMGWPRLQYLVSTKFFWGIQDGPNSLAARCTGALRNGLRRRFSRPAKLPSAITCTSRWWSSPSTTCSTGSASNRNMHTCTRISASASPPGARSPQACSRENTRAACLKAAAPRCRAWPGSPQG